jgi:hypothetical protein
MSTSRKLTAASTDTVPTPIVTGNHLQAAKGVLLDRRAWRVTYPQGALLGLKGAKGAFDEDEIDHPIDHLDPSKKDAYIAMISTCKIQICTAVVVRLEDTDSDDAEEENESMAMIFSVPFQRDMSKARSRALQPAVNYPPRLVDGFNRLASLMRGWMHEAQCLLASGNAIQVDDSLTTARYFSMVQLYLIAEARQAKADGKMNATWKSPMLNRILMRLVYGFPHGLYGRKMFAVTVGLGNYNRIDIVERGGEQARP